MQYKINDLYNDMSKYNGRMSSIDVENKDEIISFCCELEEYIEEKGLICRKHEAYKPAWEQFCEKEVRDVSNRTLYELCAFLFLFSREEYWCSGYGNSYVNAYQKGIIPDLVRRITYKLECMALDEADASDQTGRIGVAGEYFVMAELTRRGYVASLTSKNTKAIDLLVSDKNGKQLAAIQVKACDNAKQQRWKMSSSVENNDSANLYYVFVNMNGGSEPSYYVVPSKYVAYRVKEDYDNWYNTPGKNGHVRNATTMRTFEFVDEKEQEQYRDAWYLLGI